MPPSRIIEIISKRRYTFAVAFVVFSAVGLLFFATPEPHYPYIAQVDISIRMNPDVGPHGELGGFIRSPESGRRAMTRGPQVVEIAATMLRDRSESFAEFDLAGDIDPQAWLAFTSFVHDSIDLASSQPGHATLQAQAKTQEAALALAKAAGGALMQYLRGSNQALSATDSENLVQAGLATQETRAAWEQYVQVHRFHDLEAVYHKDQEELRGIPEKLPRLRKEAEEKIKERKRLLDILLFQKWTVEETAEVERLQKRLEEIKTEIQHLEIQRQDLTPLVAKGQPVIREGWRLRDAFQAQSAALAALKKQAGLNKSNNPKADEMIALAAPTVALGTKPLHVGYSVVAIVMALAISLAAAVVVTCSRELVRSRAGMPLPMAPSLDYEILGRVPESLAVTPLEMAKDEKVYAAVSKICARIERARPNLRSLWVTSARRWEGKSMVAIALARFLATTGKKVLLVDANIHNPSLQHVFEFDNEYGLTTLLEGHDRAAIAVKEIKTGVGQSMEVSDMLVATSIENLCVLPGGPPPLDPEYRPVAAGFKKIARKAESLADIVVYDCPTLSRKSEVERLSSVLGDVLIALAPGDSKELDIVSTNYVFHEIRHNVIGAVQNQTRPSEEEASRIPEEAIQA